ncbi:unnamed protein product [Closterium sp. NIES-54]
MRVGGGGRGAAAVVTWISVQFLPIPPPPHPPSSPSPPSQLAWAVQRTDVEMRASVQLRVVEGEEQQRAAVGRILDEAMRGAAVAQVGCWGAWHGIAWHGMAWHGMRRYAQGMHRVSAEGIFATPPPNILAGLSPSPPPPFPLSPSPPHRLYSRSSSTAGGRVGGRFQQGLLGVSF